MGSRRFVFTSDSSDLRFHEPTLLNSGQVAGYETFGPPIGAIVGLVVGYGANFLNVIRSEGPLLLHNGYHRAYALRVMGFTHAPCVIQTVIGLVQQEVDFKLGTATTNVQALVREVVRKIEDELKGETMTSILALVSPEFFDKLTGRAKVEDAYRYYASGVQPLREDVRQRFPFAGIVFEEYNATVTLADGATTERLIPTGEGVAFPLGTMDTFRTYGAPPLHIEYANTIGMPIYAQQLMKPDGSCVDLKTQASILPVNKRPRLAVRLYTSN